MREWEGGYRESRTSSKINYGSARSKLEVKTFRSRKVPLAFARMFVEMYLMIVLSFCAEEEISSPFKTENSRRCR